MPSQSESKKLVAPGHARTTPESDVLRACGTRAATLTDFSNDQRCYPNWTQQIDIG